MILFCVLTISADILAPFTVTVSGSTLYSDVDGVNFRFLLQNPLSLQALNLAISTAYVERTHSEIRVMKKRTFFIKQIGVLEMCAQVNCGVRV